MRIRAATPADIPTLARLSFDAFPWADAPMLAREGYIRESPVTPIEDRKILEIDGVAAAAIVIIPFQLWMCGARFSMGGIAGVAVSPEARRAGLAKALMTYALRVMRERGDVLSMLYP